MKQQKVAWASSIALVCGWSLAIDIHAQEIDLPRMDIVGREVNARSKIPGTVDVINQQQLEILQPLSLQDALKTVPGVNVRGDEGGLGSIPNIGIRGLNPSRSQKVLLLEDGAPIHPSLFISNASYYSPPVDRMSGIEVLKGASGLQYGPSNIGGVINYLTKTPEQGFKLSGKLATMAINWLKLRLAVSQIQTGRSLASTSSNQNQMAIRTMATKCTTSCSRVASASTQING
jgi:Fe(3+) dicitrate transport protein